LLDLPDDIRDFFDISFVRPGRMSPGMTCTMEICFTPKMNKDIDAKLMLLTETGPIGIPLTCTYPKARDMFQSDRTSCRLIVSSLQVVPVIAVRELVFRNVVMGEQSTLVVKIRNEGGLATDYRILDRYSVPGASSGTLRHATLAFRLRVGLIRLCSCTDTAGAGAQDSPSQPTGASVHTEAELLALAGLKGVEWLEVGIEAFEHVQPIPSFL
jgi:hypothetical protein